MDLAQPLLTLLSVVTQWCIGKADLFGYTEDKLSQLYITQLITDTFYTRHSSHGDDFMVRGDVQL